MTFRAYLMGQRDRGDAAGEFVRLARAHTSFSGARSLHELKARLEDSGASQSLYQAAQVVWEDYALAPHAWDA